MSGTFDVHVKLYATSLLCREWLDFRSGWLTWTESIHGDLYNSL